MLDRFGIDVNDPANGIALPGDYHDRMHTKDYYDDVNARLLEAVSREEALTILAEIAAEPRTKSGR